MDDYDFIEDLDSLDQANATKKLLIDTKKRIGMVLDLLPVGLLIHQRQGILFANQTACAIFNQSQTALIGQHFLDYAETDSSGMLHDFFENSFVTDHIQQIKDVKLPGANDSTHYFHAIGAILPWEGTPVIQIVLRDITEERERERKLEQLSATDPLTGACNRRGFIRYTEQLKQQGDHCQCGLIFFDVDHFKQVNDQYGHAAGDIALREIVLRTQNVLSRINNGSSTENTEAKLARLGGEEFAIVLPDAGFSKSSELAEEVRREVASRSVGTHENMFDVNISLGVTCGDLSTRSIDDIMREADIALYAAKNSGRNCVRLSKDVVAQGTQPPYHPISRQAAR